jgi:phospholipase/lecithinase/hemolysin
LTTCCKTPEKPCWRQHWSRSPTFAFVWLGNNDVLGYATSGGTNPPIPDPGIAQGLNFTVAFDSVMTALNNAGLHGHIIAMNVPDVVTIPYFTAVGPVQGDGAFRVKGINDGGEPRDITDDEYICLPGASYISPTTPLEDKYWLSSDEIALVEQTTAAINAHIAAKADEFGYVLVDVNAYFNEINETGYQGSDRLYTTDFITGGLFSLDGIHPTTLGYKLVANKVIEKLNSDFGTDISTIN